MAKSGGSVKELLRRFSTEAVSKGQTFSKDDILEWLEKLKLDFNSQTIKIQIDVVSINNRNARSSDGRPVWGPESGFDIFYKLGPDRYQVWDPKVHKEPPYYKKRTEENSTRLKSKTEMPIESSKRFTKKKARFEDSSTENVEQVNRETGIEKTKLFGETLRIYQEKPLGWQYKLLFSRLNQIVGSSTNLRKRWISMGAERDTMPLWDTQICLAWIAEESANLEKMIKDWTISFNETFQSIGRPDLPGEGANPDDILRHADQLGQLYRDAMLWSLKVSNVNCEQDTVKLFEIYSRLPEKFISDFEVYCKGAMKRIDEAVNHKKAGMEYKENLIFTIKMADDLAGKLAEELEIVKAKYIAKMRVNYESQDSKHEAIIERLDKIAENSYWAPSSKKESTQFGCFVLSLIGLLVSILVLAEIMTFLKYVWDNWVGQFCTLIVLVAAASISVIWRSKAKNRAYFHCKHGILGATIIRSACSECRKERTLAREERLRKEADAKFIAYRLWAKNIRTSDFVHNMDPMEFEKLACEIFSGMGYGIEMTPITGDNGVDAFMTRNSERVILQCKRFKGNVGEPVLRDLYGTMHASLATSALLVTTGRVSRQARKWAENKPIRIVEFAELRNLIEHQFPMETITATRFIKMPY